MLALIALFVALGGSAVAAGIVPHAKFADKAGLANNALKVNGKTAAQIVASVPAPSVTSVSSLVSVATAAFSLNPQSEQNITATCAAGSKATGGGFANPTTAGVLSFGSFPTADGTGWTEDLLNESSSTVGSGTVYAVCIK